MNHPISSLFFLLSLLCSILSALVSDIIFLPDLAPRASPGRREKALNFLRFWYGFHCFLFHSVQLYILFESATMIPLLYSLLIVEYVGRICIGIFKPLETLQTPPGATGSLVILGASLVGLLLSLRTGDGIKN